jgi:hypothetical protein
MKKLSVFIVCFILSFNAYAQTTIDSVRVNDSTGVPVKVNTFVDVTGVITSTTQFGTNGPVSLQDKTAGMAVYQNSSTNLFVSKVQMGDSVGVHALLTNYSGLAEMSYGAGSYYTLLSSGHSVEPKIVTISDIVNQQWNGIENLESVLIRLNNITINSTGTFANAGYSITDITGTLSTGLYIKNASIIGTAIPNHPIDIIGILSQHSYGPLYNNGYQLQPRFIQDIISDQNPLILNSVFAVDVDTNALSICFQTVRKGNTQVKYGLTSNLELDSVLVIEDTTFHNVRISNLNSGTKYYFQAISENAAGRS